MGYTTDFDGVVNVDPPLNDDEITFLNDFAQTRRMRRDKGPLFVKGAGEYGQGHDDDIRDFNSPDPDQPGLWCQWVPTDDGAGLTWDGGEKFYEADLWMKYIVQNLLGPTAKPYVSRHINEDPRLANFTCNHTVNGVIDAQGEGSNDKWALVVENNVVKVAQVTFQYKEGQEV